MERCNLNCHAGTTYKLRLVLADATGLHDASVKLFKALPGADPAYELKALSSDAAPIATSNPIVSGGNSTEAPLAGAYGASNPTSPQIQVAAALAVKVDTACMGALTQDDAPASPSRRLPAY